MTDKQKRCADCLYLVEDDNGTWVCTNCYYEENEKDIESIDYCEEVEE